MGDINAKLFQDLDLVRKTENVAEQYLKIAKAAEELVEASYADESDIKENNDKESDYKIEFPIDIELVASHLGIKIEKKSLNREEPGSFSRVLGIITSQDGKAYVAIDNEVSYKTQRYTIANAVGRFLLNQTGTYLKFSHAIPLIPQSPEEIAADSIALFLLLPMKTFKEEFLNYLEGVRRPPTGCGCVVDAFGQ